MDPHVPPFSPVSLVAHGIEQTNQKDQTNQTNRANQINQTNQNNQTSLVALFSLAYDSESSTQNSALLPPFGGVLSHSERGILRRQYSTRRQLLTPFLLLSLIGLEYSNDQYPQRERGF